MINLEIDMEVTMKDRVFFPVPIVKDVKLTKERVTKDEIGMYAHDGTPFFDAVLEDEAEEFYLKHKHGISMKKFMGPQMGYLISSSIKHAKMTPYAKEDWLLIGFNSYSSDQ